MMNDFLPAIIANDSLPDLPIEVRTLNGARFDPRMDKWVFRDSSFSVSIDFNRLKATAELVLSAKKALVWYAENKSIKHMTNMFNHFLRLLKKLAETKGERISTISSQDLLNYRSSLTTRTSWYLGALSGFMQKWHDLGIPGVTDDAIALLKQLRIKGNQKGEAILTMDSENGSFTDIEVQAIQDTLGKSFDTGKVDLGNYVLVMLFMALGQRSVQYAALKVCDVVVGQSKEGTPVYVLNVPRAKQRGQSSRGDFRSRVLIPQIGEKLVRHAAEVRDKFRGILPDPEMAPLFPAKQTSMNEPKGFEYHLTSESLSNTLKQVLNNFKVLSERTGGPLHITATRFRRTVGTRAAIEGHGELVIAELLDHTDTQNVGVYVQAVPEIIERIDRAMAMHLAPLAQAFAGIVISNESESTRSGDPSSMVCDPRFDSTMKPMGNCGKHGFCGSLAPIACYTCQNFQPWLDGPHETVLDHLISERERLLVGSDLRIAAINDRTILAVAEVVRRCQEIRDGLKETVYA